MHELPSELADAQRKLDMRRHQPTSAEHGLAFRLRNADVPHEYTEVGYAKRHSEGNSVGASSSSAMQYPTWWGEAGSQPIARPTYEDLGQAYPAQVPFGRREDLRSSSLPLLHSKFNHEN